jgi:hypothetical protein
MKNAPLLLGGRWVCQSICKAVVNGWQACCVGVANPGYLQSMMPYLSGTSVLDRHRERRPKELKAITALAPKISFPGYCILH